MRRFPLIIILCLCLAPFIALAADCPAEVESALMLADQSCSATGRNQVCYGNITLTATPKDGVTNLVFSQPGDLANVGDLQSLQLSSMSTSKQQWGMALMKLQADLPDTLPGQNVTVLLFGDVQVKPASNASTTPLQAFYFKSGANDAPCAEAPSSGLLIQSPVGGQRVNLTINGVDLNIGSTVYLQAQPSGDMQISTLAGVVQVTADGQTVISVEGTSVSVPLDANGTASAAPNQPSSLNAKPLMPFVKTLQSYPDLLATLADDDAANPVIQQLIQQKIMIPGTPDAPVPSLPPDKIDPAIKIAEPALQPNISTGSPITAGIWKPTYGPTTTIGVCRAAMGSCDDCNAGQAANVPICYASDSGMLFLNNGGGVPYQQVAPGDFVNETKDTVQDFVKGGSYELTQKTEYHVVSPTHIEVVNTYQEEGGCTMTSTTSYDLVQATSAACVAPTPEPSDSTSASSNAAIQPGNYTAALTPIPGACASDKVLPAIKSAALSLDADGNLVMDYGSGTYTLPSNGDGTYALTDVGAQGLTLVTVDTVTADSISGTMSISDSSGNTCVATLELKPSK